MRRYRVVRASLGIAAFAGLAAAVVLAGCKQAPVTNGYRPGIDPGITKGQVVALLGPPQSQNPFDIPGAQAYVMTYAFGQLLLENDRVVTVTVASDPTYVGPFGITLGMQDDAVKAAFASHHGRRTGHEDNYDVVVGPNDTRTRDIYDQTDHVLIEMAAANPNDSESPYDVISITRANDRGFALMMQITKAKVGGLYPDQHVFNFESVPWPK
jgi:hypothetical protein